MEKSYYIGLDGGTTNIKAVLLDESLLFVDEESAGVKLLHPFADAVEIDMEDYWLQTAKVLKALALRNPQALKCLRGVCVTGQGDGMWPVRDDGSPAYHAVLWNDTRSKIYRFDDNQQFNDLRRQACTNRVYAGSVTAILKWMQENQPEVFHAIGYVLHCKDWINYRLTGEIFTDYTDSSTAILSIPQKRYVYEQLEAFSLGACKKMFPQPVPSTQVIGSITAQAAAATGLPIGIPVAAGAVDVCAAAVGMDMLEPGDACSIIGTTLANQIVLPREGFTELGNDGLLLHHAVPGMYINILPTLSGATSLDFVRNLLFPEQSWGELEDLISQIPIGCNGLLFHPYLYGERAPFPEPNASGGFFGLKALHSKAHFMRSAFEGLSYTMYDCFCSFSHPYHKVFLAGGASKNGTLCQMFADVLDTACYRVFASEPGSLGAARILQVALGDTSFSDILRQQAHVFSPDHTRHQQYHACFEKFLQLRKLMMPVWAQKES